MPKRVAFSDESTCDSGVASDLRQQKSDVASLQNAMKALKSDHDHFKARCEKLEDEVDEERRDRRKVGKENERLQKENDALRKTNDALQTENEKLEDDHETVKKRNETLLKRLDDLQRKHEELEQDFADLCQQLSERPKMIEPVMSGGSGEHKSLPTRSKSKSRRDNEQQSRLKERLNRDHSKNDDTVSKSSNESRHGRHPTKSSSSHQRHRSTRDSGKEPYIEKSGPSASRPSTHRYSHDYTTGASSSGYQYNAPPRTPTSPRGDYQITPLPDEQGRRARPHDHYMYPSYPQ